MMVEDGRREQPLLADSTVFASFAVSHAGTLTAANARFAALLGAQPGQLLGQQLTRLVSGRGDWDSWRKACVAGRERNVTLAFRAIDGQQVLLRGDLVAGRGAERSDASEVLGVFVDVTEEEKLRQAVQRGARMEALGSLTSGIAHDFNNLLTVLVGNLYLVGEELRGEPECFEKLKAARDAAKRGADLIRQLLAFARREAPEAEIVDAVGVVERLAPLLRRALGAKVELETRFPAGQAPARCNAAQLESAVVNLCVNARDAIEDQGRVAICVEVVDLDAGEASKGGVRPGEHVKLTVADDGVGIAPEHQARIFEPFFSTKSGRGGTGLGLSMVRWFADQAGGGLHLESMPGRGTRISLLLPLSADASNDTSVKTAPLSTLRGGDETVLVFAADENLRSTVEQILDVLGYTVHLAVSPGEVLSALRDKDGVDLLLIDAAAQYTSQRQQLLRAALDIRPGLGVVFMVDGPDAIRARRHSATPLLPKPFSIAELAGEVRRALDADTATA